MKTITVSDEMFTQLCRLSEDMNNQDNRATADPILFELQVKEQSPTASDYSDLFVWRESSEYIYNTIKELRERIDEYFEREGYSSEMTDREVEDCAEEKLGIERAYYLERWVTKETFFTLREYEDHVRQNSHHYTDPRSYVVHAWRNPGMELVVKFLKGISKP